MISVQRELYAKIQGEQINAQAQQPQQVSARPNIKNLGVIGFTEGASQHFSLGDSKSCTLTAKRGSGGMIEIAATIEVTNADGTVSLIGKNSITDAAGAQCALSVRDVGVGFTGVGFTPQWKTP